MFGTINATRPAKTSSFARAALDAMTASQARHVGYSLHRLWRSVGQPERQGPNDWLDLARPMADGMNAYRRRLHSATRNEQPGDFVSRDVYAWANTATIRALDLIVGTGHGYEEGDVLVDEETATLYALFLDFGGLRRNLTAEGKRSRRDFEAQVGILPSNDKVHRLEPMPKTPSTPVPAPAG